MYIFKYQRSNDPGSPLPEIARTFPRTHKYGQFVKVRELFRCSTRLGSNMPCHLNPSEWSESGQEGFLSIWLQNASCSGTQGKEKRPKNYTSVLFWTKMGTLERFLLCRIHSPQLHSFTRKDVPRCGLLRSTELGAVISSSAMGP